MQVQRTTVTEILRQRGSDRTARAVEEQLPEHIDTERDSAAIKECGINPLILEDLVAANDR